MAEDPARMLRAAVLAKLRAECPELLPDEIEVRIYSRSRKQVIALVVIPREGTREADRRGTVSGQSEDGSGWAEAILRVLRAATKPLKARAIAVRAGKDPKSTYLGKALRKLIRAGKVVRVPGEALYWLADRPLPGAGQAGGQSR